MIASHYPIAEVDVIIVSYNAGNYIEQALKSVLSQNTNFLFTLHLFDDCSTDNTVALAHALRIKNKNVEIHTSSVNLGTFANLQKAVSHCKANFIALLEGDDYWKDEDKLQRQIDFLKNNQVYVGCASNSIVYDQKTNEFKGLYNSNLKTEYTLPHLFSIPHFQIGTLVYRQKFLPLIPDEFKNSISNDKVVYTLLAEHGTIYCINKPLTVYRKHENSISNSETASTIYAKHQLLYGVMKKHFDKKYHPFINEALYVHLKGTLFILIDQRNSFRKYLPEFICLWLRLGKVFSLKGLKECVYIIINLK